MRKLTEALLPLAATITDLSKPPVPPWMIVRTGTHNGIFTAKLPDGDHRTFKIKTQPNDANFMPEKRIVYLMIGSDPEDYDSWQSFGFWSGRGIVLWKTKRSDKWKYYADLLFHPAKHPDVEWNSDEVCIYCNRMLTTPRSAKRGYGPVCAVKQGKPY